MSEQDIRWLQRLSNYRRALSQLKKFIDKGDLNELEQQGLICGYRARLSRGARGNPSTVFVSVTLTDQRQATMMAFEQALESTAQVTEAHLMSGESDYLLKVLVREDDSYERIHREVLSALPGVHRLVTQFTIRTLATEE